MTIVGTNLNKYELDELMANVRMEGREAELEVVLQPDGRFTLVIRSAVVPMASRPARDAPAASLTGEMEPSSTRLPEAELPEGPTSSKSHAVNEVQPGDTGGVEAN